MECLDPLWVWLKLFDLISNNNNKFLTIKNPRKKEVIEISTGYEFQQRVR